MTEDASTGPTIEQPPAAPTPRNAFASLVFRLARELSDRGAGGVPRGELASLRREDGARSPVFYKLAARMLGEVLDGLAGENLTEAERRWARVVHLLAKTSGQHRPGASSFGAILADADLAEPRFLRALRAEGDALDAAVRNALAPVVQKALGFDPVDLAALVLSAPHRSARFHYESADSVRRRIARDFYRAEAKQSLTTNHE